MASVFTKIINGELPCYKIYEDEKTMAFLNIHPEVVGHTLVVPKIEVTKVYELPDDYYAAVMATAKKLAQHYDKISGKRTILKVVGIDVPHAHVHVMPMDENWKNEEEIPMTDEELKAVWEKFKL